jgi:hypothetical protein
VSELFLLGLAVATSLIAYLAGRVALGLSLPTLASAVARAFELIGMSMLFLAINVAVGLFLILAVRTLTPVFLSVYLLNDTSLVGISLVQGLVFETWRARPPRS